MSKIIFKCRKCGSVMKGVYLAGCGKCGNIAFDVVYSDDMRKKALEIIHGAID